MNAQGIITRLHVDRNPHIMLPAEEGQKRKSLVFALRDRKMGVDGPQVHYVSVAPRRFGFQPAG